MLIQILFFFIQEKRSIVDSLQFWNYSQYRWIPHRIWWCTRQSQVVEHDRSVVVGRQCSPPLSHQRATSSGYYVDFRFLARCPLGLLLVNVDSSFYINSRRRDQTQTSSLGEAFYYATCTGFIQHFISFLFLTGSQILWYCRWIHENSMVFLHGMRFIKIFT